MIKCSDQCTPCCDHCIHAYHEYFEYEDGFELGGPIGCVIHKDRTHQRIAVSCGWCDDFYCSRKFREVATQPQ